MFIAKAVTKQLAVTLMKYHKEEVADAIRANIKVPVIVNRSFHYVPKKDIPPILLFLQSLEDEVQTEISNFWTDTGFLINDIIESAFIGEIREWFIEPVIYNIPEANEKLTEKIIELLPEKEKRLYKATEQFLSFLETVISNPERLKPIEQTIRNNVSFYITKYKKKKTRYYETNTTQNNESEKPETPEEILKEIGQRLQNTNALRDKNFNLRMLGEKPKRNKHDEFFFEFITQDILSLISKIPNKEKSIKHLWEKAYKRHMSEYFHHEYIDEFQGRPTTKYLSTHKHKQTRFYVEINPLISTMKKLKKQFPFTEREKWIKEFKRAEDQYRQVIRGYAEFIHIAYVLQQLNVINTIPKMPGWLSLLANLYKELKRYEKRTEYLPEKIERKILKAEKSEKDEILTLF